MPTMLNFFGDGRMNAPRTYVTFGVRVAAGRTLDKDKSPTNERQRTSVVPRGP
jgi:hypothetical protein